MNTSKIKLQFKRLKRHHGLSLHDKDEIAFLDLAHSLRIFVDMKFEMDEIASHSGLHAGFNNTAKNKKVTDVLRENKYFSVPMSSEVGSPDVSMKGLIFIPNKALNANEIKMLYEAGPPNSIPTKLSFVEWLGSTIINTANPADSEQPRLNISREIFIKRVANILGASHPDKDDVGENRFDPYIKEFHTIEVANGYPLTYYQLLEISSEIIRVYEPLLKD
jgi:hypothetical protein